MERFITAPVRIVGQPCLRTGRFVDSHLRTAPGYRLLCVNPDGTEELVFKGLESARTNWTPLAQQFQRDLYLRIFRGEP
jgi:hypothetical protein